MRVLVIYAYHIHILCAGTRFGLPLRLRHSDASDQVRTRHKPLVGRVEVRGIANHLRDENAVEGVPVQQREPADKSGRVRADRQLVNPVSRAARAISAGSNAKSPRPRPALVAISQMLAALNSTSVSPLSIVARISPSSLPGSASAHSRTCVSSNTRISGLRMPR